MLAKVVLERKTCSFDLEQNCCQALKN